jgi:preprotein translocase subunit SecE
MVNPIQFVKEARNELMKVVWPTRQKTINVTLGVIFISLAVALLLGAADFGLTKLFEYAVNRQ